MMTTSFETILSDELEEMGFDITTACNGQETIEVMRERTFEMLVFDVRMPGIDGFQVLRYTKERFPLTQVIMVTAFDDLGNAMKSRRWELMISWEAVRSCRAGLDDRTCAE